MRVCVAIWSLGQAAMLTALLPRDCCAAHPAGAHARTMADTSAPAEAEPCPMGGHGTAQAGSDDAVPAVHASEAAEAEPAATTCTLRAVCNGPLAALASLLSATGVTPEAVTVAADDQVRPQPSVPAEAVRSASRHPDPPPPRA